LREIVKAILPTGLTPVPAHWTYAEYTGIGVEDQCGQRAQAGRPVYAFHEAEVFYSLEQLLEELDPVGLAGQIRAGSVDLKIFGKIANTIKCNCEDWRKGDVARITDAAAAGDVFKSIRACFELLRLMKIVSMKVCH